MWPTLRARCCSMLPIAGGRSEMLDAAGNGRVASARAYESPEICGQISDAGAAATGLKEGTPVVAGAGDQAAGAIGMGVVSPGSSERDDRNLRSCFCGHRSSRARSGRPPAHFLPRSSRTLACDGRDPGGGTFAALVPRSVWRRYETGATYDEPHRGSRAVSSRLRWSSVGPVSDGRAHSYLDPTGPRSAGRDHRVAHAGARHSRDFRRRCFQPARYLHHFSRN